MKLKQVLNFGFGFFLSIFLINFIFSYHIAEDIIPGTFQGNYSFKGNINVDNAFINGVSFSSGGEIPLGTVIVYPSLNAPQNWSNCNGSLLNIVDYPDLYSAIGVMYGGDNITTFALPDLRGEFIRGFDNGRGVDGGRVLGSFQDSQFEDHGHSVSHNAHKSTWVYSAFPPAGEDRRKFQVGTITVGNPNSGNYGLETRPRNVALNYIIKIK